MKIPRLSELRRQAGEQPDHTNISDVVRDAVSHGDLAGNCCVGCESDQCRQVTLWVNCECPASSGLGVLSHILSGIGGFIVFETPRHAHGHENVVRLPLLLCKNCQSKIPSERFEETVVRLGQIALVASVVLLTLFGDAPTFFWSAVFLAVGGISGCLWSRRHQAARQRRLRRYADAIPLFEKLLVEYPEAEIILDANVTQELSV